MCHGSPDRRGSGLPARAQRGAAACNTFTGCIQMRPPKARTLLQIEMEVESVPFKTTILYIGFSMTSMFILDCLHKRFREGPSPSGVKVHIPKFLVILTISGLLE